MRTKIIIIEKVSKSVVHQEILKEKVTGNSLYTYINSVLDRIEDGQKINKLYLTDIMFDSDPGEDQKIKSMFGDKIYIIGTSDQVKEESDDKYRVVAYPLGAKIYVGRKAGMMSSMRNYYLSKLTSTKMISSPVDAAKTFDTWSQLSKFIRDNGFRLSSANSTIKLDLTFMDAPKNEKQKEDKKFVIDYFETHLGGVYGNEKPVYNKLRLDFRKALNILDVPFKMADDIICEVSDLKNVPYDNLIICNEAHVDFITMKKCYEEFLKFKGQDSVPFGIVTSEDQNVGYMVSILYFDYSDDCVLFPYSIENKTKWVVDTYTFNLSFPPFSEYGAITVETCNSKILRRVG